MSVATRLRGRSRDHGDRLVRALTDADLPEALALCERDPVSSLLAHERLIDAAAVGLDRIAATVWGYPGNGPLTALCWAGANIVPVVPEPDERVAKAFATALTGDVLRSSSVVGPAETVMAMWDHLSPVWGPARDVRPCQPLLAMSQAAAVAPDQGVRRSRPADLERLVPACIAMFTEEVGYSPVPAPRPGMAYDPGSSYARRVAWLVAAGRSFSLWSPPEGGDGSEVVFKAEIGSATAAVAQLQGVWVNPDHRGRGIAAPAVAAVVNSALTRWPTVSLYVNDFNERALRTYAAVGFERHGTFATVLF